MYKEKRLILDNNFTRDFIWKEQDKIEFIETIMRNIPSPLIYLYQDIKGNFQIIDGKQRLLTAFYFIENKIKLNNLYYFPEYNGIFFSDIDKRKQFIFENYQFSCYILRPPISENLITDIFVLLNTKGKKANEHELRRSIFKGHVFDLLESCANHKLFIEVTRNKKRLQRGKDQEVILRFFAMYIWLNIKKFEFDSMNDLLNQTTRFINDNKNFSEKLMNAFEKGITKSVNILGNNCFNIEKKVPYVYFNRVLFETLCNIAVIVDDEHTIKSLYTKLKNNERIIDYKKNNTLTNIKYRYQLVENLNNQKC